MRSLRFDGETDDAFRERATWVATVARVLVEACLKNAEVQAMLADGSLRCTIDDLRRSPIVRVEFEQARAIGEIGECLAATRSKHWGDGPQVLPLAPDDPVHPSRILFVYKEASLYNRRFQQRRRLKELLGRPHRRLVGRAMWETKGEFLARLAENERWWIRRVLHVEPGEFWRAARGRAFLTLPPRLMQLPLEFREDGEAS
jgi:hypothetical protein